MSGEWKVSAKTFITMVITTKASVSMSFLQTKTTVGLLSPFILTSWGFCLQSALK